MYNQSPEFYKLNVLRIKSISQLLPKNQLCVKKGNALVGEMKPFKP